MSKKKRKKRVISNDHSKDWHHIFFQKRHWKTGWAKLLRDHSYCGSMLPKHTLHRYIHENIKDIPFDQLNKECTYIFELVSPLTQVVIKYDMTALFFLAARNVVTGEEFDTELGAFRKPRSFSLKTLDECMSAALELNKGEDIEDEGFVVVDANHNRVKIKSPAYVAMHRISTNKVFTAKRMSELFCQGEDFSKLAKDFPSSAHVIKYYDWQFAEVRHKTENMILYSRRLFEEYDCDRKAVAMAIKDSPYAWAGFKAIGNSKDASDIMKLF